MNKIMITAIICSIILGLSFYSIQINKQESIERQKQMEMDQKDKQLEAEQDKLDAVQNEKANNEILLDACLVDADTEYFNYAKLNWKIQDDWSVWATDYIWNKAQKMKDIAVDICFKKYK